MHLSIELLIENNSDEDIFVGDMNKGLAYWHIPSKGRLTIQLNNPNWFQLRVSNAYIYDNIERSPDWKQKVAYVSVSGSGYVEKKNVEYEDDYQIIYTNLDASLSNDSATEKEYILYNKETSVGQVITKEEFVRIKRHRI